MTRYLLRRLLYAVPILFGVNLLTFLVFFVVNSPNDMARFHLGFRRVTPAAVVQWKQDHGYNEPLLLNRKASGLRMVTDTVFFRKSMRLFWFQFGRSDDGRDIGLEIERRAGPSLAIAIPTFVIGIAVNISLALFLVLFRSGVLDRLGQLVLVVMMSVSTLFYVIGGQFLFAESLKLVPVSGYASGIHALRFVVLPVLVGVVSGLGSGARLYRTFFLEEIARDYVRSARARGLSEIRILFRHVLPNGLVPILTGAVAVIPSLFLGSLILESFFSIPGLGAYTLDAIQAQDFATVRAMVFLGAFTNVLGYVLADISYTLVDPRIRLS